MADRNQLRVHRESDIDETDPLAELTRIMGFDPRHEPAPSLDDDFGIDLERELMGEFEPTVVDGPAEDGRSDVSSSQAFDPEQPEQEPDIEGFAPETEAVELDDGFDATFEEMFATHPVPEVDEGEVEAMGGLDESALEPSDFAADDITQEFEMAFDEAIAGDLGDEWQPAADDFADEDTDVAAAAAEIASEESREIEADDTDAEIDIDFTGQLSPISPADEASLSPDYATAPAADAGASVVQELSLEDELSALLGASHPATAPAAVATPDNDEPIAEYEAPTDVEDSYEAQRPFDAELTTEPEAYEEVPPAFEAVADTEDFMAAPAEESFEVQDDGALEDSIEFDFVVEPEFQPEAESQFEQPEDEFEQPESEFERAGEEFEPAEDTAEEPTLLASEDLAADDPVADASPADMTEQDFDLPKEINELAFDEGEFEAALADGFSSSQPAADADYDEDVTAIGEPEPDVADAPQADPLSTLATMGLEPPPQTRWQPASFEASWDHTASRDLPERPSAEVPEIDTIEVQEAAVALADDLDIPDVAFEDDAARPVAYDDFEADLSQAFDEPAPAPAYANGADPEPVAGRDEFDADFDGLFEEGNWEGHAGYAGAAAIGGVTAGAYAGAHYAGTGQHEPVRANGAAGYGDTSGGYRTVEDDALGYDPAMDDDIAIPHAGGDARPSRKRGFAVAAIVAGIAIASGAGAFVYSFSGGDDAPPALVKADQGPVKVKPENPGGVVVPNQENKVYESVAGGKTVDTPAQEKLISGTEEPVDIPATPTQPLVTEPAKAEAAPAAKADAKPEPGELPGVDLALSEADSASLGGAQPGKAEDRIDPDQVGEDFASNEQLAAVAPRKVRTMIVRPDGTLVPREEPAAVPAEPATADAQAAKPKTEQAVPAPAAPAANQPAAKAAGTAANQPAPPAVAAAGAAAATAVAAAPAQVAAAAAQAAPTTAPEPRRTDPTPPARAPVVPSRPADQPVDIVGEVKARTQVAAAEPAAAAAAAASSSWSMQIASQPTPEGAQATYQDLARRYDKVLNGRGVNIVKAEIAGKGTFWRVRVPVESRNEAIQLCNRYKAAGGSCFVAQ